MNYDISIAGQSYTVTAADAAQAAAITACRQRYNDVLPQTIKVDDGEIPNPALIATDADYLSFVFGSWAKNNPGFTNDQLQAVAASAFASYVEQNT